MKDVHLEYTARIAGIEFEYYAEEPGGLVQSTEIVLVMEIQPQNLAGLHLLHSFSTIPTLRPRPMTMVLPSIVGNGYHTQQASITAEQDQSDTFLRATSIG